MPLVKKAPAPSRTAPQSAAVKKSRKSYSILFKAEAVASVVTAQRDLKAKAPLVAALERFKNTPEGKELNKSCISDWWKDQERITKAATSVSKVTVESNRARARKIKNETAEAAIVEWCLEKTKQGMLLTGLTIREKALAFQEKMDGRQIECSKGWLYSFCNQATVAHGEAGSVNVVVADAERVPISKILEGHDPKNMYRFEETSLFWRQFLTRGYALDGSDKRRNAYVGVPL